MVKYFCSIFFTILTSLVSAQDSTAIKRKINLSAAVDVYSTFNLNNPTTPYFPSFLYNHTYTNQVSINLAYLKASYQDSYARYNASLMAGTYAETNLSGEPAIFRSIYEANVGTKISKKHNLWIDVGIMPSHIGFESAVSKDCWTLTRSLCAENSPYYEAGAKITFTSKSEKWVASVLYLNGWQRIKRIENNSSLNGGWQIQYKPNDKILLNSSTYFGNEQPDTAKRMRYFHNFYMNWQINTKVGLILGFDNGMQESMTDTTHKYDTWWSPVAILKHQFKPKWSYSVRGEYYSDKRNVVFVGPGDPGLFGLSLNLDYSIHDHIMIRAEGKLYSHHDAVFPLQDISSTDMYLFTMSVCGWF